MNTLHVKIATPFGLYKEFDTPIINIQTVDGDRGVSNSLYSPNGVAIFT